MKKFTKRITAVVIAVTMATSMAVSASAACAHTTFNAYVREPYYTRTVNVEREREVDCQPGDDACLLETVICTETTTYGQLYQACVNCGYLIGPTETSLGTTHSVSHL